MLETENSNNCNDDDKSNNNDNNNNNSNNRYINQSKLMMMMMMMMIQIIRRRIPLSHGQKMDFTAIQRWITDLSGHGPLWIPPGLMTMPHELPCNYPGLTLAHVVMYGGVLK